MSAQKASVSGFSIALAMLLACNGTAPASVDREAGQPELAPVVVATATDDAEPVMRTYTVPPGRAETISSVLREAFSMGRTDAPRGRVSRIDEQRIAVVAPASLHAGIAELCEELSGDTSAAQTPSANVDVWVVRAVASEDSDASGLPEVLRDVGSEILRLGPAQLALREALSLSTIAGDWSTISGRSIDARFRFVEDERELLADVHLSATRRGASVPGARTETRVRLERGVFVVLAQMGDPEDQDATLYYVIRVGASGA